jgi:hypothetical protein
MSRSRVFSFIVSIVWVCAGALQINGLREQILYEQRNGLTEWETWALLVFWVGVLVLSLWSCWISSTGVQEEHR